jgi:putative ABC transport system permease protein
MASTVPLFATDYTSSFVVEGWPPDRFGAEVMHRRVTDGWFETMNVPLLDGRFLDARDRVDTEPVVVINETLRRQFFQGEDPIGRRIAFDRVPGPETTWARIVGVTGDIHQESVSKVPRIEVFHPVSQDLTSSMAIVVHGQLPPSELTPIVRTAVAALDPDIPLAQVQTLEEIYTASMRQDRFLLTLLGGFAALALTLAALGVYGVASQAARRRTQEIGIRVALGARRADVARLILGQALRLAGAGVVLGVLGGLAATRLMASVLFGIVPTDPATFVVVPLLLAGVAVLASWVPARGATRVDPLTALRTE